MRVIEHRPAEPRDPETGLKSIRRLDTKTLPKEVAGFYDQIIGWGRIMPMNIRAEYMELAEAGHVVSMMADSPECNGWATQLNNGFVTGLHAGLPSILHFTFNHLLRFSQFLPHIGDPGGENPEPGGLKNGIPLAFPPTLPVLEGTVKLPGISRPECDERSAAASALTELACAFSVFHETSHIVAGHAGYLASKGGLALLELDRRSARVVSQPLREVWEYEADKIAAIMLLGFLLEEQNHPFFRDVFQLSDENLAYTAQAISIGVSAAYVLFLLLGQESPRLNARRVHPHPMVRMTYIHNTVRLCARDDLGISTSYFDTFVDRDTEAVLSTWHRLGAPVPALSKTRLIPPGWVVRRRIEQLQDRQLKLQPVYTEHSWLPDDAWRDHRPD